MKFFFVYYDIANVAIDTTMMESHKFPEQQQQQQLHLQHLSDKDIERQLHLQQSHPQSASTTSTFSSTSGSAQSYQPTNTTTSIPQQLLSSSSSTSTITSLSSSSVANQDDDTNQLLNAMIPTNLYDCKFHSKLDSSSYIII